MATQIFGRDHAAWLGRRSQAGEQASGETPAASGGALRGLFYVIVFYVVVAAGVVGGWELWRHIR